MKRKAFLLVGLMLLILLTMTACTGTDQLAAPGVTLSVDPAGKPAEVSTGVQLLVLLTVLSLAPSILIMATSFTRIIMVLSLLRNALGTPSAPPTQVLLGLALLLTFFSMTPVISQVNDQALQPYLKGEINQTQAFDTAVKPFREFMFRQTREKDLELFLSMGGEKQPETLDDIPTLTLMSAFVISELKTAFIMGFVIYVPFLIIDMIISSILLSMGMMMLPPSVISLPFKILLFVMVDGWYLIARSLLLSFQ
ncbi:MAG TPA: flagellar type III secretion system pore protein FliP [Anaerolineaceae bacterium]|nr:flagellar type III secretion system pore protein FliP [Anaerolineaceae bacterium]HPN52811.1 flagellar type III secretion system pore protein FliP [Anaerolineaceae bacterium]